MTVHRGLGPFTCRLMHCAAFGTGGGIFGAMSSEHYFRRRSPMRSSGCNPILTGNPARQQITKGLLFSARAVSWRVLPDNRRCISKGRGMPETFIFRASPSGNTHPC